MAKKYVYIDGVRYEVVNNYILGLDVYSDGSIPTPTASDDGKVITVDENGNYVLGEGGGAVILAFEYSEGSWITDVTPEQFTAALTGENLVVLYLTNGQNVDILQNCKIANNHMYFTSRFMMGSGADKIKVISYELYTDDSDVYLYDTPYQFTWS